MQDLEWHIIMSIIARALYIVFTYVHALHKLGSWTIDSRDLRLSEAGEGMSKEHTEEIFPIRHLRIPIRHITHYFRMMITHALCFCENYIV